MNRKALIALWTAVILLAITWIFPPVHVYYYRGGGTSGNGWGFVLDPLMGNIDLGRLLLADALILVVASGVFFTVRRN